MLVKNVCAALIATGLASAAAAEEHIVILTGFSYFPAVTYAQSGDTVVFVNESGEEQTVVGKDVGWIIGPLDDAAEGMLVVDEETELKFFAAYVACSQEECDEDDDGGDEIAGEDYGTYDDAPIRAEITFDAAPLSG